MIITKFQYRLLFWQLFLIIPLFVFAYLFDLCIIPCKSFLYGVFIAFLNIYLVVLINHIATLIADRNPKKGVAFVFAFAGVRFMLIAVLFAVGLAYFALPAVPMVFAFIGLLIGAQILNFLLRNT